MVYLNIRIASSVRRRN